MTAAKSSTPFVAIACGGTGGHLFPGLAVAEQLRDRGCRIALLISPKDVDQQAVKNLSGLEILTLPAVALQRGRRLAFLRGFCKSWSASRRFFRSNPPQAALAMGGFTSAPPILAARGMGAKTFLHESNTIPGRANRWIARVVSHAFVGFPQAASRLRVGEATVTGTPVRPQFQPGDPGACRVHFGFEPARPLVLVTGGSQGASGLNDLVLSALPLVARRAPHWQWLHLTGTGDVEKVKQAYAVHGLKAVVHPFLAEMDQALAAASAVVSRAGASSLAEIAAVRVPALLVPFPSSADNHQFFNAQAFVETGAAQLLEQKTATPVQFFESLHGLAENAEVAGKMKEALARWHAPKAAAEIAEMILGTVTESSRQPVPNPGGSSNCKRRGTLKAMGFGIWSVLILSSLVTGNWSFIVL